MNTTSILLVSILILAVAVFVRYKSNRSGQFSDEHEELSDLNEKFLNRSHGQEVIDLVKTFNASDNMILRSILDSKGIDTYVKSNHFGDLYPTFDTNNFASSVISIFSEQSSEAILIVEDYLKTLKRGSSTDDSSRPVSAPLPDAPLSGKGEDADNFHPELLI